MPSLSALLLAAGESKRMGRPKALLRWQGTTLVEYQVAQLLEAGAWEVIAVLGHAAREVQPHIAAAPGVRPLVNPHYTSGRASSVRLGVGQLHPDTDTLVVLAVDQPRPAALLRHLVLEHWQRQARITVPEHDGRRGHPVVFDKTLFQELASVSEEGQGLREVMARHRNQVTAVAVDDPAVHLDLNTPPDYERALALFPSASEPTAPEETTPGPMPS